MKLYIAGPMTGYAELNFPAFHAEARRLRALGFEIVNPAELNPDPTAQWLDCMRVDIAAMMTEKCDGVALLPGWEQSKGAPIEHNLMRDLGLRVYQAARLVGLAGEFPVLSQAALGDLEMEAA
ncbi:DUF4406 domain-containing protein [Paraburkholderia tropica]|uniref:DUF4406 domain-containing protein n=1 Tax=Paraburkholderia tropica TaxID=92647 RepID=UPI002AB69DAD|nr:DUF4406 domain-containing protein [Paraburkholderia tropica]